MAVSDWSAVADENTTVDGINIAEHCPAKNINNAIRSVMASVKKNDASVVHTADAETITGAKTFTEKLFLTPKEGDRWAETFIYGTENTAKLKIQNKNIDAITDPDGYPPRSSLTLETIDNAGQGRFTLRAQSKYDTINKKYYQYDLVGTSDGTLTWTGGGNPSTGDIEIVDSSSLPGSIGYIRYSSGLQICWGYVNCVNYGYKSKYSQFTFPVAFKDPTYQVTVCPLSSSMNVVANIKSGRTTTYCNIGVRDLSQSSSNWTADVLIHVIGYWK